MIDDKIVYVTAGGRKLPLCYNLGACKEIAAKLGDTTSVFDLFRGGEDAAEKEIREAIGAEEKKKDIQLMDVLPYIVGCLARGGQARTGDKGEPVTEAWIEANIFPSELPEITVAICEALAKGLEVEHGSGKDKEVDLVQEQIEKN